MMPDEFDKKREVVKSLMSMLHANANDEMSKHMAPKKEVSMEKISVKPGESVSDGAQMAKGGMIDLGEGMNDMVPCSHDDCMSAGGMCKYAEGGLVENSSIDELSAPNSLHPEPESAELSGSESSELHPAPNSGFEDPAKNHETSVEDEDEENNQSAFRGLMRRKK